jgi:hypothetical protein
LYVRNRSGSTFDKVSSGISALDSGKIVDIAKRGEFLFAAVDGNNAYYAYYNNLGKWYQLEGGSKPTCFDREQDFDTDYSHEIHVGRNGGVDRYLIGSAMMLIPNDSTVDSRLNGSTLLMRKLDAGVTLVSFEGNPILYAVNRDSLVQMCQFPIDITRINDVTTLTTNSTNATGDETAVTLTYAATDKGVATIESGEAQFISDVGGCSRIVKFKNLAYAYGGKTVYLIAGKQVMSSYSFESDITSTYATANQIFVISGGVLFSVGDVQDYQVVADPTFDALRGAGFGNVSQIHDFGSIVGCIRNATGSGNWTAIDPTTGTVLKTFGGLESRSLKCACTSFVGEIQQNYIGTDSGYYEIDETLEHIDGPYLDGSGVNDIEDLSTTHGNVKLIGASDGLYIDIPELMFENSFNNDNDATVGANGLFASTYPTDASCDSNFMMIYMKNGKYGVVTGINDNPDAEDRYTVTAQDMGDIQASETINRVVRTGARSALVLTSRGMRTTSDLVNYPWWQTSENNLKETIDIAINDLKNLDTLTGSYVIRKSGTVYSLNRINYQTSETLILSSGTRLGRVGTIGGRLLALSGDAIVAYDGLPTTHPEFSEFSYFADGLENGVNDFTIDGNFVYAATDSGIKKYSASGIAQDTWMGDFSVKEIFTEGGLFFKAEKTGTYGVYEVSGTDVEAVYEDSDRSRYDRTNGVVVAQSQTKLDNGNTDTVVNLVFDSTGIDERPLRAPFVLFSGKPKKDTFIGTKNVTSIAVTDSAAYCVANGTIYTSPNTSDFTGTHTWRNIIPSGIGNVVRIFANDATLVAFTDTSYVNINIENGYSIVSTRSINGLPTSGKISTVSINGENEVFVPTASGVYQMNPSSHIDIIHSGIVNDCHDIAAVGSYVVVLNYSSGKNCITQLVEGEDGNPYSVSTVNWYECDSQISTRLTRMTTWGSGMFIDDGTNCIYAEYVSKPRDDSDGILSFTLATSSPLTIKRTIGGSEVLFVASDRTYKAQDASIPKYTSTYLSGKDVIGIEHYMDDGGNDSILALISDGIVRISDGSIFYGGNFSIFRSTYLVSSETNVGMQTLQAVGEDESIFNSQETGVWVAFRIGNELIDGEIRDIIQYDNESVVYIVGQCVMKSGGIGRVRHFGACMNELKNLNNIGSEADGGYRFLKLDDQNFLIGYYGGFKYFKDNVIIRSYYNTSYGTAIDKPVTAIGSGDSTGTDGRSYYVNQGTKIYETNDLIGFNPLIETLPQNLTVNQIVKIGDRDFIMPTSHGLYYTRGIYELRDDINTQSFKEFNAWIWDFYDGSEKNHISSNHRESDFIQRIAQYADTSMTNVTLPKRYQNIPQSIEFNDGYQYIRGGVRNFYTQLKAAKEVYQGGFVNRMEDSDIGTLDMFALDYIVKRWNNGKMEFFIHVPTTMTYYMNHVAGFGNCRYEDTTVARKNIDNTVTDNKLNEKYTRLRIYVDQSHFNLKSITAIQINGTSLPLKVYKDDEHPCSGFDGLYHSVIQPSMTMTIPIEKDGNNVARLIEENSNNIVLEFAVYGTDEQSIRFIAQAYPTATIHFVNNQKLGGEMPDQVVSLRYDLPFFQISRNMFTKDGYMFKGWSTDPDSSEIAYPDRGQITPTSDDDVEITLYPVFEKYNWDDFTRITFANPIGGGETVVINEVTPLNDQNTTIIMGNEV